MRHHGTVKRAATCLTLCLLSACATRAGRPERALARLQELPGLGWDYALDDSDFPRTRAREGYAEVAAELARRSPQVIRGEVARVLVERDIRSSDEPEDLQLLRIPL